MKKIILASLALSTLSSTAYATDRGFYVGLQGGYADTGGINQNTLRCIGDKL